MLKNYFKIAIRNLQKQKVFACINVFGLSVGIACFSLLLLFASYQFSFDKFHKNAANIYRPYEWTEAFKDLPALGYTDCSVYAGAVPITVGEGMKKLLPDVEQCVRVQLPFGESLLRVGNNAQRMKITFTDASFFSIFTFPLKYGNTNGVLHGLNDIVLTESKAKQLFGSADVIGKTVEVQIGTSFRPFIVSAVANDVPANSTIQFDELGNFDFAQKNHNDFFVGNNWHPTVCQDYIQLRSGSKLAGNTQALANFLQTFNPNMIRDLKSFGFTWKGNDVPTKLHLQPMLSIHTDAWLALWGFTDYAQIDPKIIWILLAIATGILLIACINFTTLAIGRSAGRSKEVGVRKVIGAEKHQIIFQFLSEALLLSIASGTIGVLLAVILLPWFNTLAGTSMQFSFIQYPQMGLLLIITVLAAGLLAGSYPALVLSKFKPLEVLKNKIRVGGSNLFTKSLVTFQFVISIVLIVSTVIILQQTNYMVNKSPGFNKENVVAVDAEQTDPAITFPVFKNAVSKSPWVVGVASAAAGLGSGQDFLAFSEKGLAAAINIVDTGYIRVLGMQLIAGGNVEPANFRDSIKPIVINETMMREFGWTANNAVGKQIKNFQGVTAIVKGVVRNFNYRPLSEGIKSQVFEETPDAGFVHFYVRIHPGNPAKALADIRNAWAAAAPGIPIKYSFLDDDINNYYKNEQHWTGMVAWAGGISIFLACLGLLGLAALAAINRTKEIGVRKVLGATVTNIIILISSDFVKLVAVSFIIATPVAWYCMSEWLQGYANRISISWAVFIYSGVFAFAIALITISYQAVKAAVANPVKSLRSE